MTERFNVAGALLVKLFGRHDDEADDFSRRAGRVRDIGVRSAMYGRVFFIALDVGRRGRHRRGVPGRRPPRDLRRASRSERWSRSATYVTRVYGPLTALTNARVDIMSAFVSFDRVFEVLDTPNAIVDAPGATDLVRPRGPDRARRRLVPLSGGLRRVDRVARVGSDQRRPLPDTPGAFVLRGITASIEPGSARRARRAVRWRQDHDQQPDPEALRRDVGRGAHRRPRRARRDPGIAARRHRRGRAGPASLPRHRARRTCSTRGRTHRSRSSTRRVVPRRSTTSSSGCPTATTPSWASAGTACRAARSNGSRSPGCCSRIRRSSSSTKPPATSTPRTRPRCRTRSRPRSPDAPRSSSPTDCRRSRTPTRSSWSTKAASSNAASTTDCSRPTGLYAELYRTLLRSDVEPIT